MGLWEFLKQWQRGRLVTGIAASLLVHVLLALMVIWGLKGQLTPRFVPKRGDTIIVELPKPEEPANAGTPNAGTPAPPAPVSPSAPPTPARPPSPPAARPAPPPRQAPGEERRVASAPRPAPPTPTPRAAAPAPRVAEPLPRTSEPAPRAAEPEPAATRAPDAAQRTPEPAPRAQDPAAQAPEPSPQPPSVERREGADRQVASVPPSPAAPARPSASDVKAALRGGAGGQSRGHGGIEGTPIRLDSTDERFSNYLEQIRRRIQEKWGFPCVRTSVTRQCEVHDASLELHFGILKDGRVQFVDLVRSSQFEIYDEYAMNAIRLAQPFPPVPASLMAMVPPGSTGIPIAAHFTYVVDTSLTKLLR